MDGKEKDPEEPGEDEATAYIESYAEERSYSQVIS